MADVPIVNRAMTNAPKDYTLPQSQEILLKAVRADIDGTSAAGSYLPALQLVSNNGDVMWTAVDTSNAIAAGGTQSVTWFPGLGAGKITLPLPGQILQSYYGNPPASDFTFASGSFVTSNFPTNTTFTKISSTSAMQMLMLCDFTSPTHAPDVVFCGVFVDSINAQTTGSHSAVAATFMTIGNAGTWSTGLPTQPILPAGNHTVQIMVACNSATSTTLRSSTSCELTITEYEP